MMRSTGTDDEDFVDGGEEDEDPPVVTEERLAELDAQAREKEIQRMMETPAMIETDENDVTQTRQRKCTAGNSDWRWAAGSAGQDWWRDNSGAV